MMMTPYEHAPLDAVDAKRRRRPLMRAALGSLLLTSSLLWGAACDIPFFPFDRTPDIPQGSITGQVVRVTPDGEEFAAYAGVVVQGAGKVVTADSEGRFTINGIGSGKWNLRILDDADNDGQVDHTLVRSFLIDQQLVVSEVPVLGTDKTEPNTLYLGVLRLNDPGPVSGTVRLDDSSIPADSDTNVKVYLTRDTNYAEPNGGSYSFRFDAENATHVDEAGNFQVNRALLLNDVETNSGGPLYAVAVRYANDDAAASTIIGVSAPELVTPETARSVNLRVPTDPLSGGRSVFFMLNDADIDIANNHSRADYLGAYFLLQTPGSGAMPPCEQGQEPPDLEAVQGRFAAVQHIIEMPALGFVESQLNERDRNSSGTVELPYGVWDVQLCIPVRNFGDDSETLLLEGRLSDMVLGQQNDDVGQPLWGPIGLLPSDKRCYSRCLLDGENAATCLQHVLLPVGEGFSTIRDCDEDGVAGMDPTQEGFDELVVQCSLQCAAELGANDSCNITGLGDLNGTYDCDDDGDTQPDVTEGSACYGPGLGTDLDGDGLCSGLDAYPECSANTAALCEAGRFDLTLPEFSFVDATFGNGGLLTTAIGADQHVLDATVLTLQNGQRVILMLGEEDQGAGRWEARRWVTPLTDPNEGETSWTVGDVYEYAVTDLSVQEYPELHHENYRVESNGRRDPKVKTMGILAIGPGEWLEVHTWMSGDATPVPKAEFVHFQHDAGTLHAQRVTSGALEEGFSVASGIAKIGEGLFGVAGSRRLDPDDQGVVWTLSGQAGTPVVESNAQIAGLVSDILRDDEPSLHFNAIAAFGAEVLLGGYSTDPNGVRQWYGGVFNTDSGDARIITNEQPDTIGGLTLADNAYTSIAIDEVNRRAAFAATVDITDSPVESMGVVHGYNTETQTFLPRPWALDPLNLKGDEEALVQLGTVATSVRFAREEDAVLVTGHAVPASNATRYEPGLMTLWKLAWAPGADALETPTQGMPKVNEDGDIIGRSYSTRESAMVFDDETGDLYLAATAFGEGDSGADPAALRLLENGAPASSGGGEETDGGIVDDGGINDGGVIDDGGVVEDGGVIEDGGINDGGINDGGVLDDGGSPSDGGVDPSCPAQGETQACSNDENGASSCMAPNEHCVSTAIANGYCVPEGCQPTLYGEDGDCAALRTCIDGTGQEPTNPPQLSNLTTGAFSRYGTCWLSEGDADTCESTCFNNGVDVVQLARDANVTEQVLIDNCGRFLQPEADGGTMMTDAGTQFCNNVGDSCMPAATMPPGPSPSWEGTCVGVGAQDQCDWCYSAVGNPLSDGDLDANSGELRNAGCVVGPTFGGSSMLTAPAVGWLTVVGNLTIEDSVASNADFSLLDHVTGNIRIENNNPSLSEVRFPNAPGNAAIVDGDVQIISNEDLVAIDGYLVVNGSLVVTGNHELSTNQVRIGPSDLFISVGQGVTIENNGCVSGGDVMTDAYCHMTETCVPNPGSNITGWCQP
mgnify:CR=1 FL=1